MTEMFRYSMENKKLLISFLHVLYGFLYEYQQILEIVVIA